MDDSVLTAGHSQMLEGMWRDIQLEGSKEVPVFSGVPYASSGKTCSSVVSTGNISAGKTRAREPKRGDCEGGQMTVGHRECRAELSALTLLHQRPRR